MVSPVVDKILPIFLSEGVSKYTIQELAKRANISTKTIYKNFESKEKLLAACLCAYYSKFLQDIKDIYDKESSPILLFMEATSYILAQEFSINRAFFTDINKNFKEVQDAVLDGTHPKFPDLSIAILKKGIEEGSIQKNVIPELFMVGYARLYHSITREDTYSLLAYNVSQILDNTIFTLIKGILTEKGLREYSEYKRNFNL